MPTVVITANSGGAGSVDDTEITVYAPAWSFGAGATLGLTVNDQNALVKFNHGISGPVTVSAVTLELFQRAAASTLAHDVTVHRVNRAWVESLVTETPPSGASWTTYDGINSWGTAGAIGAADSEAAALVTLAVPDGDIPVGYQAFSSSALTALVQSWINGSITNHGLLVKTTYTGEEYGASEDVDGQRPKLTITYTAAGTVIQPGNASAAFTGRAPAVSVGISVAQPSNASIALTGRAPTVVQSAFVTVTPGQGSLAFTGRTPFIIKGGNDAAPGAGSAVFTGRAPGVVRTLGGALPHVFGTKTSNLLLRDLDEQFAAITVATLPHRFGLKSRIILRELDEQFAAALSPSAFLLPHVFATKTHPIDLNNLDEQFAALQGVLLGAAILPAPAQIVFTGGAPNVAVTTLGSHIAFPGRAALAFTGRTPTLALTGTTFRAPGAGSAAFIGRAPSVVINVNRIATPGVAAIAFTGRAPTASVSSSGGLVTAAINASQLSGPAPLGVVFDATSTTRAGWSAATVFRRCLYTINYGKAAVYSPGTFTNGHSVNNSKDADVGGPIGATVFEQPGTYTVSVLADDLNGNTDTETITITVTNPDTAYSGTNTVCVSTSGDFTGAPAGAQLLTQSSVVSSPVAGRRYLYRAGQSFTGTVAIPTSSTSGNNIRVGSFGSGAKPIVNVSVSNNTVPTPGVTWPQNIAIYDIQVSQGLHQGGSVTNLLVHRCTFPNTASGNIHLYIGNALEWWVGGNGGASAASSEFTYPKGIVISENSFTGNLSTLQYGCLLAAAKYCGFIGNSSSTYIDDGHLFRPGCLHKSIVAHNTLLGTNGVSQRTSLKLGGFGSLLPMPDTLAGFNGGNHTTKPATSLVVVANNKGGSSVDSNQWTFTVCPENDEVDEGLVDVMIENNVMTNGPGTTRNFEIDGLRMTYINNTLSTGGAALVVTGSRPNGLPPGWGQSYYTSRATP